MRNNQPLTRYSIQQMLENETSKSKDIKGEVRTTQNIDVDKNNLVIPRDEECVIGVIHDRSTVMYFDFKDIL